MLAGVVPFGWARGRQAMVAAVGCLLVAGCALEREPLVQGELAGAGVTSDDGRGAVQPGGSPVGPASTGGNDGAGQDAATPPGTGDGDGDGDATDDATGDGDGASPTTEPPGQADDMPPPDDFGLSCGGVTCPAVAAAAEQCCTGPDDVKARLARSADACGVERGGAAGCLELEQSGVIDGACPDLTPPGASSSEPGCCTDGGRCGTFDSIDGIGCHENGALDEACGADLIDETLTCEPTGLYAIKAEVDVTWGGRSGGLFDLTDDGRGSITILILAQIDNVGAAMDFLGTVKPCATRLPPFYSSVLCESYQPLFPDAIWDSPSAPEFDTTGRFQCLNPGCILTFDPVTTPVGIELDDPDGAWPTAAQADSLTCSSGEGDACFPDQDSDGKPGVTVLFDEGELPSSGSGCSSGYELRTPPLNANPFAIIDGVVRADRLHLGVRIRLGASGRLSEDCGTQDGLGVADFVQSRAASCMLEPGSSNLFERPAGANDPCSDDEALFMNENLPIYDILRFGAEPRPVLDLTDTSASDGPRFEMLRIGDLGDDVSCAQVREAF